MWKSPIGNRLVEEPTERFPSIFQAEFEQPNWGRDASYMGIVIDIRVLRLGTHVLFLDLLSLPGNPGSLLTLAHHTHVVRRVPRGCSYDWVRYGVGHSSIERLKISCHCRVL